MRRKTVASRQLPSKIVQSCQVGVLAISPDALLNDHTRVEVPSHLLGKQHGFLARRPVAQHAHVTFSHYAIFEYDLPIPTKKRQEKPPGQTVSEKRKKKPKKKRKKSATRQLTLFSAE